MIFHQIRTEQGCQSYMLGCRRQCAAIIIDPEISQLAHYQGLASQDGLTLKYLLDTHTHADHFSAGKRMAAKLGVPLVMHDLSPAPFVDIRVDDGEMLLVGDLRLRIMHTPGHTADSICVIMEDRVFTGDTLLIGGTGRTDLPTGDPEQLYDSLFNALLKLDPALLVYPAHIYSERTHSTLGEEIATNPRLQKKQRDEFVSQMRALDLKMPTHLTEALRTNLSGGKTVNQLINEAAQKISFMSQAEVFQRIQSATADLLLLDVRERTAFDAGHIPGAINIPRGQLELRVNELLPDPTKRVLLYCEFGKISTLAAATLKDMGFNHAIALDSGIRSWQASGYPLETGA
ncbi:MBL fold metallo-hydrolase [Shewanella salipaludis]|uniref:MBL fold metallo-hydrolase n=1 Tax=Shewanella salipaludis TaxID=2723052 RepID=A0A972JJZ7_9GAMM|nr:MBL fold metallo-hydrolase [Shewanella salipaludis]NMH66653.1 MBL fold metallo-hydrolase [Shewanella salipaludis]